MQHPLENDLRARGANLVETDGLLRAADFGSPEAEYHAARAGAAIYDASHRGLIEVTGRDRAAWLNNLVTNAVRNLQPGDGTYAFATNVKGRILFDLNVLARDDAMWLDIDRRLIDKAMKHLDRYIIMEDVKLADRSDAFVRIALVGPKAADIADALGATQAPAMASLGWTAVPLRGRSRVLVRHDFAGVFSVELYVESTDAAACWNRLIEIGAPLDLPLTRDGCLASTGDEVASRVKGLTPIGDSAIDVLRIEAGIPVYGRDIDEDVLPAETGQTDRAVNYAKGCYLGQEIIERMRSRASLARKLVGLRFDRDESVTPGTELAVDGAPVGRVTSTCYSWTLGTAIGLGYVKVVHANPGTKLQPATTPATSAEVAALPFQ